MARKGRRKGWSYTAGHYPHSVRVFERGGPGGVIYASAYDGSLREGRGGEHRMSLGHRDRDRAITYADEQALKLRKGLEGIGSAKPTVRRVLSLYLRHRTPDKGTASQREDTRQIEMWRRFLGDDTYLSRLSRREWDAFRRMRQSGELDARGRLVAPGKRSPVGDRVVQKNLVFLRAVCRWASEFREGEAFLLESDPTRGLEIPFEKNPNRPVATHDRVDAIRSVYRKPTMRVQRAGKRETVESYLPEIFEIVVGTGRRIRAIRELRWEDLDLEVTANAPHGAIVWPADTDKMGKRWRCPVSERVRDAIEAALRKRQAVGSGYLFPAPEGPSQPVPYEQATAWLKQAERLAALEPLHGSVWHAYRRLWASSRKGLPDVDVARAGGWSSLEALKMAYQQPDDATILLVVTHEAELREVR